MENEKRRKLLSVVAGLFIIAMAVAFSLMLSGCHPEGNISKIKTAKDKAVDACIAAGGVPMFSAFNGSFNDCKFNPYQSKVKS